MHALLQACWHSAGPQRWERTRTQRFKPLPSKLHVIIQQFKFCQESSQTPSLRFQSALQSVTRSNPIPAVMGRRQGGTLDKRFVDRRATNCRDGQLAAPISPCGLVFSPWGEAVELRESPADTGRTERATTWNGTHGRTTASQNSTQSQHAVK